MSVPQPWEPAARPDADWLAYHEALVRAVRAAQPRIVFLGDSISERWRDAGREVWKNQPLFRQAFTLGIGGDTTQNVLWRIAHGALAHISPQAIVLMIGVNNVKSFPAPEIVRGILATVHAVRAAQPDAELVLYAVLPAGRAPVAPMRPSIAAINEALDHHRFDTKTHYRNITSVFTESRDDQRAELYLPDEVHLSALGYAAWARDVVPVLEKLLAR